MAALGTAALVSLIARPRFPKPPEIDDVAKEKRRQLALRGTSRQDTQRSGGAGVTAPILGSAPQILGVV